MHQRRKRMITGNAAKPPTASASRSSRPACRPIMNIWWNSSAAPSTTTTIHTANNGRRGNAKPVSTPIVPNARKCTALSQGGGNKEPAPGASPPMKMPATSRISMPRAKYFRRSGVIKIKNVQVKQVGRGPMLACITSHHHSPSAPKAIESSSFIKAGSTHHQIAPRLLSAI